MRLTERLKKWTVLIFCLVGLLLAGCTATSGVTQSGSDEWSRGVILGLTEDDPVAVTTWEDTTFVAWVGESGRLQLAQLDAALNLESVTELALPTAYPYAAMLLEAESANRLHVVWLDSIEGVRTIIHAQLTPGEVEPVLRQEISVQGQVEHVQFMMRLESQRLEVFWSDDERFDSGIYHQAISLEGGEATPPVQLTETGWQPVAGWGQPGEMQVSWLEAGQSGYFAVWCADFDPEGQALEHAASVTQVRMRRGRRFLGPTVGNAGGQNVVAWAVGYRLSVGRGRDLNPPGSSGTDRPLGVGAPQQEGRGAVYGITSDRGQYTIVPPPAERASLSDEDAPIYSLTTGEVVEIWLSPRMRAMGDQTWAVFSAWVKRRSDVRMQVVIVPFGENGPGESIIVSKTRPSSVWPDLTVNADNTLRSAWVEPLGNDIYRVVVASTAPEALEALGGFSLAEVWNDVATFVFENVSLLGYAPYVIGWAVLPVGLLLVATVLTPSGVRGWKAAVWLGGAIVLQLVCKQFLAPQMMPFDQGIEGIALCIAPVVISIVLMWIYWRWVEEPLLVIAFCLCIGVDAFFSIIVMGPRLLWGV